MIAVASLALTACTSSATPPSKPVSRHLNWRTVALPTDPRGRATIRAVAGCDGRWYVAGAILLANGATAPAAWISSDGSTFARMAIKPVSYYGIRDTLNGITCRGNRVVAVGASNGGAHGNPRTSTWLSIAGGPLIEKPAGFELYGGENAIGVGAITAGKSDFLIVGARIDVNGGAGAAVWTSGDGATFTLRDGVPALESDGRIGRTEMNAAAPVGDAFVGVGAVTPPNSPLAARDPIAWTSVDGASWRRIAFPHTASDDSLLSVGQVGGNALAIGTGDQRFIVWAADPSGTSWHRTASFGATATSSTTVPAVPSVVTTGAGIAYVVVSTAAEYQLWRGAGPSWTRVALPETVPSDPVRSGPRLVCAAVNGSELMLATDDGTAAHLLFAPT